MTYQVFKVLPADWKVFSEDAHKSVFNEKRPWYFDRIDYVLMTEDIAGTPIGYVTVKELDHETVYWQYGGAFPPGKDTTHSFFAYKACIDWTKDRGYKRISTLIENTNIVMLKFAMKVGYLITGVRNYHGQILLEHTLEFEG